MRFAGIPTQAAAALFSALLFAVSPASAQTISNTATASWYDGSATQSVDSNTVELDVDRSTIELTTFRPLPGSTSSLPIQASVCSGAPLQIFGTGGGSSNVPATQTNEVRIGETLIIHVAAPAANVSSSGVDRLVAIITTPSGDREEIEIFETGADTGEFTGAIRTRNIPPAPTRDDCVLSVASGEQITVAIAPDHTAAPVITTLVTALADPFGFVFDSEDGTLVSGARVTLVDADTGLPATVFADDGVTPWPSTVLSGQPIVDGAGNIYQMQPGEFRFPLAPLGNYRLVVEPPAPYSAPSVVTPERLASLSRPGGGAYIISDASYGNSFSLISLEPVRVDIPLDRPNVVVNLTKNASKPYAQPGDAVFYTITVQNPDSARSKREVRIIDTPSPSLRLRAGSIRIDGAPAENNVTIREDGGQLVVVLDELDPGATRKITYAMTVRPDAAPGQAINRAEATDIRGETATAEANIRIERDNIASRMTIIGRVTEGACSVLDNRLGIPGVRVMLEDGSFAITDRDGRYHFEGVVPGTHVVQVQRQTLPEGGEFVDCDRSSRTAGSAISRFVIGQGGSLQVADFTALVPGFAEAFAVAPVEPIEEEAAVAVNSATPVAPGIYTGLDTGVETGSPLSSREASGAETDWLALGDGPTEFLFPEIDHNPRAPAVRVVIRHEAGQSVELLADGKPVNPLTREGTNSSADNSYAISQWRGVRLDSETTRLTAMVKNADGTVATELARDVVFVAGPWRAELLADRSNLVADGETRPVVAVHLTDRRGRPIRSGVSGAVEISAPYQSAALVDQLQLSQLAGGASTAPGWIVEGDDGIAYIELAPTMVSGPLQLRFNFVDGDSNRLQELDSWVIPGDLNWTIIGLAEGSVGERTVADNMERTGQFDSDLGDKARVALYAKGQVLGKFLVTLAYDSAKDEDDQRLLGTIDPNAYYTVFADGSDRRFDAASREKLYLRIESSTFYAIYGDFVTGFDQTQLARYQRTATGVKAEGRFGGLHAQGFAAEIATRYRRDEIQGNGLTGPYRLSSRFVIPNSENVVIETRDRFRSELIVSRRELIRFIDYDLDLLSGTISFKEPVLSRDFDLNPQFIVIDYEVEEGRGEAHLNAGVRADYTIEGGDLRFGVSGVTDKGDGDRTDLAAVDVRARIGDATEVRAEYAVSRTADVDADAWLAEIEHRTGDVDILAYARSAEADFGTGQQSGAELGRRKFGVDARYEIDENLAVVASAWFDESLSDATNRKAVQVTGTYRTQNTDARLGIAHFSDQLADGRDGDSTVLEAGVTQRLLDNRLELSGTTSIALDNTDSIDLPARHRLRASYAITNWLNAVGTYEIADGEELNARNFNAGFEMRPWSGSRIVTTLGKSEVDEFGKRSYAAFGLAQNFVVDENLSIDATIDGNRTLSGGDASKIINPAQPVASGGQLSQDGAQFEDFTAVTLGAAWRKGPWAATARGEYRDGEFADRTGATVGVIRQLGNGVVVGSGATWTRAEGENGTTTEIFDGALSAAFRPDESEVAFLGKLEFRSDFVENAVAGETGPAGRTALLVDGTAKSQRLIASLSTNWSPRSTEEDENGVDQQVRRSEFGLFLGARYNFDRFDGFDLGSTALLGGLDARIGIGDRFEIGGSATVRTNIEDGFTSFSVGPQIGFVPADNALLTVGYNVTGFRDEDFSAARNTDRGFYASVRLKFDADSFGFLGLGR